MAPIFLFQICISEKACEGYSIFIPFFHVMWPAILHKHKSLLQMSNLYWRRKHYMKCTMCGYESFIWVTFLVTYVSLETSDGEEGRKYIREWVNHIMKNQHMLLQTSTYKVNIYLQFGQGKKKILWNFLYCMFFCFKN